MGGPVIGRFRKHQPFEGVPELLRHTTVDAKVDGVGQEYAGVDEHRDCVCDVVVDKVEAHAGIKSL